MSGSGGSGGSGTPPPPPIDPTILTALVNILQTGTGPEMLDIQKQLLRRLLIEGNMVPTKTPAPRNISEVGGYLNLLDNLGLTDLQTELITSALGVASPAALKGVISGHPLAMISMMNDRPSGTSQPLIPLNWYARSDFRQAIVGVLKLIHAQGGQLPLLSPLPVLPPEGPTFVPPNDWLPYMGREISVVPTLALNDPTTDIIALASTVSKGPYTIVCTATGAAAPAAAPWYALKWTGATLTEVSLPSTQFIDVVPILANAGFCPSSPIPTPGTPIDIAWSRLTNITGLIRGVTTMNSEISLLYSSGDIGASAIASYLHYAWDGKTFSRP